MKLVNMLRQGRCALGLWTEDGVIDVSTLAPDGVPRTMMEALRLGRETALELLSPLTGRREALLSEEEIVYAPAVDDPEKILCIGRNYAEHVREVKERVSLDGAPDVFAKFRNALAPHRGTVRRNPHDHKHDYEAEIAVVMGRRAQDVPLEDAMDYVFGYTLANDISARDLQKAASQWTPGKACDTFCPLGPWIVTADAVAWDAIHFRGYKNDQLRQTGCSADMIRSIPALVSFLSGCFTLEPGDVILTGTPAGVILGRPEAEQDWLRNGDVLTVESEELGTLRVTIKD